jgi:hypothetical protein
MLHVFNASSTRLQWKGNIEGNPCWLRSYHATLGVSLVDCDRIILHLVYSLLTAIVSCYTWCITCWLRSYHATLGVSLVDCDRIMLHLVYPLLTAIVSFYTWCIPCWLRSYHSTLGVSLVDCDRIILHLVYPFNIWWQLLGSILSKDLRIHLIIAVYIFPNQGIQCPSL